MLQGREAGTYTSNSYSNVTCPFWQKVRYRDNILSPALESDISNHNLTDVKYAGTNIKPNSHAYQRTGPL